MGKRQDDARVAFALAVVGLALVAIGVFLPVWDVSSVGFFRVKENSLMQSGDGWVTLVAVGVAAVSMLRVLQEPRRVFFPLVAGVAILAYAIWIGTSETQMTLCSIGENGTPDPSACQKASPGLGVYLVGVGGAALAAAGLMLVRLPRGGPKAAATSAASLDTIPTAALEASKECDHCKTTIRPDATVCAACRRDVEPWTWHNAHWWRRDTTGEWRYLTADGRWDTPAGEDDGGEQASDDAGGKKRRPIWR